MNYHEIIVAPDDTGFRVTVAPEMPLDSPNRLFAEQILAMTFARLLRLEHGFKIVDLSGERKPRRVAQ